MYGNITAGLVALAATSTIVLDRLPGAYAVQILPPGGHGHELSFRVDLRAGTISNMAAGHGVDVE